MLKILLILFFVVGYNAASAQGDYVVTIKGDTLSGKVRHFTYTGVKYTGNNSTFIQLTSESGKKSKFEVLQTVGFRMDGEIYHTVKLYEVYTFMKLIKPGYLSLYGYQIENQTTWDGRYFTKKDGSLLDVPNIGFKKRVMNFLGDCPEVQESVMSGALGKSDLIKIVELYNTCIDLKTNRTALIHSPAAETWTKLQGEVQALSAFDKKNDALEMIQEVLDKLQKNQNVPSFLINGLKDALADQQGAKQTLDEAIAKLK